MQSVFRHSPSAFQLLAMTLLLGCVSLAHSQENTSQNTTDVPTSSQGTVARAVFTSQIIDREPADSLTEMSNDTSRVYFFTDLRDLAGQIVTHQWEHDGNIMAEVKFKVGSGPRWRVYSSKNLLPSWTGEWTVTVIDENDVALNTSTFNYTKSSMPDAAPTGN
ncbi:DUF2914 domain-containing protein [Kaarinaea lacus]